MKSLFDPGRRDELLRRLDGLRPDTPRRWGRMTAHQAVCHLNDSFRGILGERPIPVRPAGLRRRIIRFVAFTLPIPWPKGVPTSPEIDAEKKGSPPGDFASDVTALRSAIVRFAETGGRGIGPHHVWGEMSPAMWGRYGYRHVDHHLTQFGA